MKPTTRYFIKDTPFGWVLVLTGDEGLRAIDFPLPSREEAQIRAFEKGASARATAGEADQIQAMIEALMSGEAVSDDVRIDWSGITPFRRAVLEACAGIPIGHTRSYGWLAEQAGSPRAARAAGRVMATNPWPLLIPCHRVIGSDGGLHGYGGGLPVKEQLLRIEGAIQA